MHSAGLGARARGGRTRTSPSPHAIPFLGGRGAGGNFALQLRNRGSDSPREILAEVWGWEGMFSITKMQALGYFAGILGYFLAFLGAISVIYLTFLLKKAENKLKMIEKAENEQKSDLSDMRRAQAYEGVAARAQKKIELEQAMAEAVPILKSGGDMGEKKAQLIRLIKKYPGVALEVAGRLNKQFGIAAGLGIKDAEFLAFVKQIAGGLAQQAEEAPQEGLSSGW